MSVVLGIPESIYHSHTALSSTGARLLLDSPARFRFRQQNPEVKDAFDLGTAIHSKVLGVGAPIQVIDFDDYRSKAAQQARDESREVGRVPMLRKQLFVVEGAAEAVLSHPLARRLLELEGAAEVSAFATDPHTDVEMRARFDRITDDRRYAIDLKSTGTSASPESFEKSVRNYGYDVQQEWYLDVLRQIEDSSPEFVFITVESAPPHLVTVNKLSLEYQDMGRAKGRRARETYRRCLDTDTWPGYPAELTTLAPPAWYGMQFEQDYGQEWTA